MQPLDSWLFRKRSDSPDDDRRERLSKGLFQWELASEAMVIHLASLVDRIGDLDETELSSTN